MRARDRRAGDATYRDSARSRVATKRSNPCFDFGVAVHAQYRRIEPQRTGSSLERTEEIVATARRGVGIEDDCDPLDARREVSEQLDPFAPH